MYCFKWDATYSDAGEWLEKPCGDPECEYACATRPATHPETCDCLK